MKMDPDVTMASIYVTLKEAISTCIPITEVAGRVRTKLEDNFAWKNLAEMEVEKIPLSHNCNWTDTVYKIYLSKWQC